MVHEFPKVKNAVLAHVQSIFDEMEESMAMSHQEKYALLEDACDNATDKDELRVALEQWYAEHGEDLELDRDVNDIWQEALGLIEDQDADDLEDEKDDDVIGIADLDEEEEDGLDYNDEFEK